MASPKKQAKNPIPDFESREEEAEFWDTHDMADYWDQLKPVDVRVAKNLTEGITVRLDPDTMKQLRDLAGEKGIGPTTLIRMWVIEKMKEAG